MSTKEQKKKRQERARAILKQRAAASRLASDYTRDYPEFSSLAGNPFARVVSSLLDTSGTSAAEEYNLGLLRDLNSVGGRQRMFGQLLERLKKIPPEMFYCNDPDKILDFEEKNRSLIYLGFELYNVSQMMTGALELSPEAKKFISSYVAVLQLPVSANSYIEVMANDIYLNDDYPEEAGTEDILEYLSDHNEGGSLSGLVNKVADLGMLNEANNNIKKNCPDLLERDEVKDIYSYKFLDEKGEEQENVAKALNSIISGKKMTPEKRTEQEIAGFKKIEENPCKTVYIPKFSERTRTAYKGIKGVGASILTQDKVIEAGSKGSFFGGFEVTDKIKEQLEKQPVSEFLRFTPSGKNYIAEYRIPERGIAENGKTYELRKTFNTLTKALVGLCFDEKGELDLRKGGRACADLNMNVLSWIRGSNDLNEKNEAVSTTLDVLRINDEAERAAVREFLMADEENFNLLFILASAVGKDADKLESYAAVKALMDVPGNKLSENQKNVIRNSVTDYENTIINLRQIHDSNPLTEERMLLPMECGAFGSVNNIFCGQVNRLRAQEGKEPLSFAYKSVEFDEPDNMEPDQLVRFFKHHILFIDNVKVGDKTLTMSLESTAPPAGTLMYNPTQKPAALGLYDSQAECLDMYEKNKLVRSSVTERELRNISDYTPGDLNKAKGIEPFADPGLTYEISSAEYGPVPADPDADLETIYDPEELGKKTRAEYIKDMVIGSYAALREKGQITEDKYNAYVKRFTERFESGRPNEAEIFSSVPNEKLYFICERFRKNPVLTVLTSVYDKENIEKSRNDNLAAALSASTDKTISKTDDRLKIFAALQDARQEKLDLAVRISKMVKISVPYDDQLRPMGDPEVKKLTERYLALDLIERDIRAHVDGFTDAVPESAGENDAFSRPVSVFEELLVSDKERLIEAVTSQMIASAPYNAAVSADQCGFVAMLKGNTVNWVSYLSGAKYGFGERMELINSRLADFAEKNRGGENVSAQIKDVLKKYEALKAADLSDDADIKALLPDYISLGKTLSAIEAEKTAKNMVPSAKPEDIELSRLCVLLGEHSLNVRAESSIGGKVFERDVVRYFRANGGEMTEKQTAFLDGRYKSAVIEGLQKICGREPAPGTPLGVDIKNEKGKLIGNVFTEELITSLCIKAEHREAIEIRGKQYVLSRGDKEFSPVASGEYTEKYADCLDRIINQLDETSRDSESFKQFVESMKDVSEKLRKAAASSKPADRLHSNIASMLRTVEQASRKYQEEHSALKSFSTRQKERLGVMGQITDLSELAANNKPAANDLKYRLAQAIVTGESIDMLESRDADKKLRGRLRLLDSENRRGALSKIAVSPALDLMLAGQPAEKIEAQLRNKPQQLFKMFKEAEKLAAAREASRREDPERGLNKEPAGPVSDN